MGLEETMPRGRGGFKVGQKVRVRGQRKTARIEAFYTDIEGGVRLDRPIKDFVSWNVQDLASAKTKREKA
jgi:hypothetical protein